MFIGILIFNILILKCGFENNFIVLLIFLGLIFVNLILLLLGMLLLYVNIFKKKGMFFVIYFELIFLMYVFF